MGFLNKRRKIKHKDVAAADKQCPTPEQLQALGVSTVVVDTPVMEAKKVNANMTVYDPELKVTKTYDNDGVITHVASVIMPEDLDSSKGVENMGKTIKNDEFIWVEGYKGMDENMVCTYYITSFYSLSRQEKKQKYILNVETALPSGEEASLCKNGFHFCHKLEDVFQYYSFNGKNRFFKVRAYVNKADYERWISEKEDKMVASKIVPYKEIILDYQAAMSLHDGDLLTFKYSTYNYVFTEQDYQAIYIEKQDKDKYFKQKFNRCMMELGWSENFANMLWYQFNSKDKNMLVKMFAVHGMLKTMQEEGLSRDTIVNCIFNHF